MNWYGSSKRPGPKSLLLSRKQVTLLIFVDQTMYTVCLGLENESLSAHQEPTMRPNMYEGITLCVNKEQRPAVMTTRKRPGRPRKQPTNPIADLTDVIYVSDARSQGPPKHFPLKSICGRGGGIGRTSTIVNKNCLQFKCLMYPSSTITAPPKSALFPNTSVITSTSKQVKEEVIDDWPEDLRDLVNTWNSLPESQTRQVVKWFGAPLYPHQHLPQVVRKCHDAVSELFSASLDDYSDWLQNEMVSKGKPHSNLPVPSTPPPKVVVENQPSSLQNYCQWSSMTANQELRET